MAESIPEFYPKRKEYSEKRAEEILHHIGLNWDDLRNMDTRKGRQKRVLDLGSEASYITKEARKRGIQTVVSLDKYEEYPREKTGFVRANAEHLPFKEESFDMIISSLGPIYSRIDIDSTVKDRLLEAYRVLKKRGKLFITPAILSSNYKNAGGETLEFAENQKQNLENEVGDLFNLEFVRSPIPKMDEYSPDDYFFKLTKK